MRRSSTLIPAWWRGQDSKSINEWENASAWLVYRVRPQTKRLSLRLSFRLRKLVLSSPRPLSRREVHCILDAHRTWIDKQLGFLCSIKPFTVGKSIPLRGHQTRILKAPELFSKDYVQLVCRSEQNFLLVSGNSSERAIQGFLKQYALNYFTKRVEYYQDLYQCVTSGVWMGDQQSLWGSCHRDGSLRLSWRLILAPDYVSDYVVCHEVAHCIEFNHSRRFWDLVDRGIKNRIAAQAWLKSFGNRLHLYGSHVA